MCRYACLAETPSCKFPSENPVNSARLNAVRNGGTKTAESRLPIKSAALIAAKISLHTNTNTENIAPMPVMWLTDSTAVMTMSKERSEMLYQVSLFIAKNMLKQGIISDEEFAEIDSLLIEKYNPFIGKLMSRNT